MYKRIQQARVQAGLSSGQLSALMGIDSEVIKAWELDIVGPSPDEITMLADVCGVSAGWLLTGESEHDEEQIREILRLAGLIAATDRARLAGLLASLKVE